eukprot:TRINITY_DN4290_c0_g1_i1.p1 TRINITY_DN4290_c0_g1~~TRINITY_DN4290_c0_g1_i1.p1  ORF type:complete len:243 (-),score=46.82 TRINITY_DN4290_c0_g1_i1:667-1395(-)
MGLEFKEAVPLTLKQVLYLVIFQGVGSGIVNFGINFLIAYLIYPHSDGWRLSYSSNITCVVSDVIVTSVILPFLCCAIGSGLVKLDLKAGKMVTYADPRLLTHPLVCWIPNGITFKRVIFRAVVLTFAFMILFDPITLLAFYGSDVRQNGMLELWDFVLFKGYWGAIFGALVTPVNALVVICSPSAPVVKRETPLSIIPNSNAISPQNPNFMRELKRVEEGDEMERSPLTLPEFDREEGDAL